MSQRAAVPLATASQTPDQAEQNTQPTASADTDAPKKGRKRPGPKRTENEKNFDYLAGGFWSQSREIHEPRIIDKEELLLISDILDGLGLTPPSEYLEGKTVKKLKLYNSKHARSKPGPILTWTDLVKSGDSTFILAMRRALSRSAKKTWC